MIPTTITFNPNEAKSLKFRKSDEFFFLAAGPHPSSSSIPFCSIKYLLAGQWVADKSCTHTHSHRVIHWLFCRKVNRHIKIRQLIESTAYMAYGSGGGGGEGRKTMTALN